MSSSADEYKCFRQAVISISSSLDLSRSLRRTYEFLSEHFPIDGITLHRFLPQLPAVQLLFLVTNNNFRYLDEVVTLPNVDGSRLRNHEARHEITLIPNVRLSEVAAAHQEALSEHIPIIDRAYLVALLSTEEEVVGHLCLMGKSPNCFTSKHEEKLSWLIPPYSLAMMNMLRFRQTEKLKHRLDEQRRRLANEVDQLKGTGIVGAKHGLRKTMEVVDQLAGRDTPVLILGETGTGKELIADAVQRISSRSQAAYIKVNCGAIPDTLVDSELFGYRKGAFTGATSSRAGKFEQADGGTLFLDEIGELPPPAQVRLLRVLQDGAVQRLGGGQPIPVNVRIIAATNRQLDLMLQDGSFREDLYYRLNVFPIEIPPLRKRINDIPLLIHHFMSVITKRLDLPREPVLAKDTLDRLCEHSWPGNVRELENLVERGLILNPKGPVHLQFLLPQAYDTAIKSNKNQTDLETTIRRYVNEAIVGMTHSQLQADVSSQQPDLSTLNEAIETHIRSALELCKGKVHGPGGAAELLDINPSTLRKRMDKLGISYGLRQR